MIMSEYLCDDIIIMNINYWHYDEKKTGLKDLVTKIYFDILLIF